MKPFDEISTNAFLDVIVNSLGYVFTLSFFEKKFQCPEIFTNFGKNMSKIGQNLNLAPKLKNRFLARQAAYIGFKPRGLSYVGQIKIITYLSNDFPP